MTEPVTPPLFPFISCLKFFTDDPMAGGTGKTALFYIMNAVFEQDFGPWKKGEKVQDLVFDPRLGVLFQGSGDDSVDSYVATEGGESLLKHYKHVYVTALPQNAQSVVDAARAVVAASDALIGARGNERNDLEMELFTKINGARMHVALMDAKAGVKVAGP